MLCATELNCSCAKAYAVALILSAGSKCAVDVPTCLELLAVTQTRTPHASMLSAEPTCAVSVAALRARIVPPTSSTYWSPMGAATAAAGAARPARCRCGPYDPQPLAYLHGRPARCAEHRAMPLGKVRSSIEGFDICAGCCGVPGWGCVADVLYIALVLLVSVVQRSRTRRPTVYWPLALHADARCGRSRPGRRCHPHVLSVSLYLSRRQELCVNVRLRTLSARC